MAKEVIMKCPGCGTIVQGTYGFFNKEFVCKGCGRRINPVKDAYETVTCSGCGNTLVFDTKVGKEQSCPICRTSLSSHAISDTEVTCPICGAHHHVKMNAITHNCAFCNHEFDVKRALTLKAAADNTVASLITVPYENDAVIWIHPMNRFAFSSHVVVPEGYTALILRDGRCSAPSAPGKYVLSDTIRSLEEQLEYALLDSNAEVSVQIVFVRNQIDCGIRWTGQKQTVTDKDGKVVGTLGFGGRVSLSVMDAKRFAEFVGYKNATADELLAGQKDQKTKLCTAVTSKCFEAAHQVLISAVFSNGFSYKTLDANRLMFKNSIREMVDRELSAIGVTTSLFDLDFVSFEEDAVIKADRLRESLKDENFQNIRRYVQRVFDWEAPSISVHMKDDSTLFAELIFGGSIKFRVTDSVFFRNPEVEHWIEKGVSESEITEYCADLARVGTISVLQDILQPMINDTGADIRDLSVYYQYIRGNIQKALSNYFEKDGLSIELFSMEEKSRSQSSALNAKGELETHKTKSQIEQELYAFNQKQKVEKDAIDVQTRIDLDSNALREEQTMTKHANVRAENRIDNMYIQEKILSATDDIERKREKKYTEWIRQDVEDEIQYEHRQNLNSYTRADEIEEQKHSFTRNAYERGKEIRSMIHETELTGYQYQGDVKAAVHRAEMTDYGYKQDVDSATHASTMQAIRNETEERMELHYLNQQEIENKAKALYTNWAAEADLKTADLQHQIAMRDMKWKSDRALTVDQTALEHELEQSSAENERLINSILRKIAESDMELTEKKDAYSRLLRMQSSEDTLRKIEQQAALKNSITYSEAHLKNTLKREEQDITYDAAKMKLSLQREEQGITYDAAKMDQALQREKNEMIYENEHLKNILSREEKELIDEMAKREAIRRENEKAADFSRAMLVREKDTAHEMELLKLEYEFYRREADLSQELQNKKLEIEQLKMLLGHEESMSETDVRMFGMQTDATVAMKKSEYDYWSGHDRAEYDYLKEKARSEYSYRAEQERSERAERERISREDRQERERLSREAREARDRKEYEERRTAEKQAQERLGLEKDYMKRADDLMSKMLSIQAAIKEHSLDNEYAAINAGADIEIARVNSQAEVSKNYANEKISEMEKLMKEMSHSIQNLNDSVKKINKNVAEKKNPVYVDYGMPYGSQPISYNPQPLPPYGNQNRQDTNRQPGTNRCVRCGKPVSGFATICWECNQKR